MNSGSLNERITRALAFMLRHQPEEFDLELDRFGWGDLEDVVYALQERTGTSVEEEDVVEAIEASDRPRYQIEDGKIRALYGHSIQIDPGEPTEPPDELFIGVGSRDASRAEDRGLRSGRRAFLHLARTEEEARESGRRVAKEYAVVTVFAGEAFDEGIDFYDRGSLFLADEIPGEFLEVGEIQDDGIERDDHRRGRGRRGGDGGRRGRGRRGGGRSDRDRDDDRPRGGQPRREERPARDEAPSPEEPREPEVQETPAPSGGAPSFGLGLDGSQGQPAAPEPEPVDEPEPIAAPEPVEEPESPKGAAEESGPPASGFGAGL